MIIFLWGPDDYRRLRRRRELEHAFFLKHPAAAAGRFDGEIAPRDTAAALDEFARSGSLFGAAKFALVENAFAMDAAELVKTLKLAAAAGRETAVILSEMEKPPKQAAFLLKEPVCAERFEHLSGAEWEAFVRAEAEARGIALAPDAVRFLGSAHKGDSWALATELDKIASLRGTARRAGAIARKDLDELGLEIAPDYWPLLNGLRSHDGRARLAALEKLFALNDPPPKIFNIIAAQAGEKTARMAEYDRAVKSGKLDYEEALLDLVLG